MKLNYILILSLLVFFSCKREGDQPGKPKPYRYCLIDSTASGDLFQKLIYDDLNRLTKSMGYRGDDTIIQILLYEKDKIILSRFFNNKTVGSFTALLNKAGFCDSLIIDFNPGFVYEKYRYNELNQYVEKITYYDLDSLKKTDTLLYEWKDGNLIYEISLSKISRTHYYDLSKKNSTSDLETTLFFLPSSKNLITKTRIGKQDSTLYQYKFDEYNKVIQRREIYNLSSSEINFFWKCSY